MIDPYSDGMFEQTGVPAIHATRVFALTLISAPVVIGIAIAVVLNPSAAQNDRATPLWPFIVIACLGGLAAFMISAFGYRAEPLAPDVDSAEARRTALATFQQLMVLRSALAQSVGIVSIALTFAATPKTITLYLLGGGISLLLLAVHVWPSQRVISAVAEQLDRAGGRSNLAPTMNG